MSDADDLIEAMRAAPDDAGPRLVYADWLLSRGDPLGELVVLDERVRAGDSMSLAQLDRLLELASIHGFPHLPDDPCNAIFRFTGGGSFPTQYFLFHEDHDYYLRWRYAFSIEVDNVDVWEGDLETTTTNEWSFCETNVILAIVSRAILDSTPLSELVFPDAAGFRAHPSYHPGRSPLYGFPHGLYDERRRLELRDWPRWYRLWDRRQQLAGIEQPPTIRSPGCECGVEGLTCDVHRTW